jgi:hypothetical protein
MALVQWLMIYLFKIGRRWWGWVNSSSKSSGESIPIMPVSFDFGNFENYAWFAKHMMQFMKLMARISHHIIISSPYTNIPKAMWLRDFGFSMIVPCWRDHIFERTKGLVKWQRRDEHPSQILSFIGDCSWHFPDSWDYVFFPIW